MLRHEGVTNKVYGPPEERVSQWVDSLNSRTTYTREHRLVVRPEFQGRVWSVASSGLGLGNS